MTASRDPSSEAELFALIADLDAQIAAVDAEQAEVIRLFTRTHVEAQLAAGAVDPEVLERSVAVQVAMACRVSPSEGRKRVRAALDLPSGPGLPAR